MPEFDWNSARSAIEQQRGVAAGEDELVLSWENGWVIWEGDGEPLFQQTRALKQRAVLKEKPSLKYLLSLLNELPGWDLGYSYEDVVNRETDLGDEMASTELDVYFYASRGS
jgi:hypothetical protein